MKRLSFLILVFAILFAVFFMAPPLLSQQFRPYPLMKIGDVFDVLTPLVLLPFYWLLYRLSEEKKITPSGIVLFVILAALWVEGQGMHLSANSIGHLLKETEGGDAYMLTLFYDEVLSHYLWHGGIAGLSALLLWRQWHNPFGEERAWMWLLILAGVIYGFTFFVIVIEAGTAPLGVSFAVLVTVLGWILGWKKMPQQPLLTFFLVSYSIATIFFIGWAIYWGGLPELSQVGIID
jgi:hypothetical protein